MNKKPVFYLISMILIIIAVNVFGYSYIDLYYLDILVGFIIILLFTIGSFFFTIKMIFKNPDKWVLMLLAIVVSLLGMAGCIYVISLFFK